MQHIRRSLLPILVVGAAVLVAGVVVATRPRAAQDPPENLGTLVEVAALYRQARRIDVEAQGTVIPARQVVVQPQVSGRISAVPAGLAPGTLLKKGDLLFAIEEVDFVLAVARQRAALAEAQAQLELERGRARVAQREWELFQDEVDPEQGTASLALREPQLRAAEAAVATAEARLAEAQLNLDRTEVRSPFNAFVLSEAIEVGQTVTPQSQTMTLVGTDHFWVQASVRAHELEAIQLPGRGEPGALTLVRVDRGGETVRQGRVVRLLRNLDSAGRMARVLIEVADPLGLKAGRGQGRTASAGALLLDSYVDLTIEGVRSRSLFELPREWLREGDSLWIYADGRLETRPVEVAWRFENSVYVDQGLEDGELVVTSRIATPIDGMKLRTGDEVTRLDPPSPSSAMAPALGGGAP